MEAPDLLVIIPARAGSRRVPRKNLRPVGGLPMICHAVPPEGEAARVVVSTDDPTIAAVAQHVNPRVEWWPRTDDYLAGPDSTVEDVAQHIVSEMGGWDGPVMVIQPTSPLMSWWSRAEVLNEVVGEGRKSAASARRSTHLTWHPEAGPLYDDRVNSTDPDAGFLLVETGGCQVVRDGSTLLAEGLVTDDHSLVEVSGAAGIDVDTPADLAEVRTAAVDATVLFWPAASHTIGSGHVRRCLAVADEVSQHEVIFVGDDMEPWARDMVRQAGYPICGVSDVQMGYVLPEVVVFDRLNTDVDEYQRVCREGYAAAVWLEDSGSAPFRSGEHVIDELAEPRPETQGEAWRWKGPRWAVLRPEFLSAKAYADTGTRTGRVLVSFGGTDPAGLSFPVAGALVEAGFEDVMVVQPPAGEPSFPPPPGVVVTVDPVMPDAMLACDVLVCSAGRTVNEAAFLGVPTVAVPVNAREQSHRHADGVLYASRHDLSSIADRVGMLLNDDTTRGEALERMLGQVDGLGARRIAHHIDGLIEGL